MACRCGGDDSLVEGSGATLDDTEWHVVDLMTGVSAPVHTVGFPEISYSFGPVVSLTRTTGANIVVYRSDGTTEWLERRSVDGTVLAIVYEQPYADGQESLRWMYGYDGTSILVTHHGGIAEVTNTGAVLVELWVPADNSCEPVRWWDADTFLAVCYGQGPGSAPIDTDGNPHTYYGRLWKRALVAAPAPMVRPGGTGSGGFGLGVWSFRETRPRPRRAVLGFEGVLRALARGSI